MNVVVTNLSLKEPEEWVLDVVRSPPQNIKILGEGVVQSVSYGRLVEDSLTSGTIDSHSEAVVRRARIHTGRPS